MAEHDDQLAALRRQIDSVDTQLHDLLMQRTELAVQVGEVKAKAQPIGRTPSEGAKFVRPAREAKILRRLIERHKGKLPKAVMVRMWREMISALLQVEGPFVVAVYNPPEEPGYWDIARDHYGCRVPILGFDRLNHAISAVLEGQATVAVLPLPHEGDRDPWWRRIAVKQPKVPHVIARLPFGDPGNQRGRGLQALVIGTTPNEPTDHDRGLLVAETREPVSRSAIREALNTAKLKPVFIQAFQELGGPEQQVVEVEGFLAPDDARLAALAKALGPDSRVIAIGGYAVPLTAAELAGEPVKAPEPAKTIEPTPAPEATSGDAA
ncbi:chorismate mutase [Dongia sp.]|uniref:chorismate mutase n=1 Tax=Dongia sp. TaxID=1977262 RepID=UPI0037527F0E